MKDMKEGLSTARKCDITHVRLPFMTYTARPCEYGDDKYERANFLRFTGGEAHAVPTKEDFKRFRAYTRAALSHIMATLDAMERHQSTDPKLDDVEGMKVAAYAADTDVTPGAKVGASMLPHIAHACASLNMAITQAVECGLLPRDPGAPWREQKLDTPEKITKALVEKRVERGEFDVLPLPPGTNFTQPVEAERTTTTTSGYYARCQDPSCCPLPAGTAPETVMQKAIAAVAERGPVSDFVPAARNIGGDL